MIKLSLLNAKKCLLLVILFFAYILGAFSQSTEKVWRVNFLNPGAELELPTGNFSTVSFGLGVGYNGAYPELTNTGNGFVYIIAPFIDLQEKWFYNFNRRLENNKKIENNSGNFVSLRFLARGESIADNLNYGSDYSFSIGPTWGIQRKYGENFHLLFDLGPVYYFDENGNNGIYPIMVQLNLGFDL